MYTTCIVLTVLIMFRVLKMWLHIGQKDINGILGATSEPCTANEHFIII